MKRRNIVTIRILVHEIDHSLQVLPQRTQQIERAKKQEPSLSQTIKESKYMYVYNFSPRLQKITTRL